jgi:hypothetical protein
MPLRLGLHPSRLAALAPQDEVNRASVIVLAMRFFCIRGLRHGTGKNDAGRLIASRRIFWTGRQDRLRLDHAWRKQVARIERCEIRERLCKLHDRPRVSLRSTPGYEERKTKK